MIARESIVAASSSRSSSEAVAQLRRADIVSAAKGWIGTPYHHQASLKGRGCDCLGLIRGVWREVRGPEPETLPPYTRDWGDATGSQPLLEAAERHLLKVAIGDAKPGDVIVFRMRAGVAKHAAVVVDASRFIHAQEGIGVAEVTLSPWWRRRVCAAFRFPGVE